MLKIIPNLKQFLLGYWHYVLLLVLLILCLYQSKSINRVSATIHCEKPVGATIAISKSTFHNVGFKKLFEIEFDTARRFTNGLPVQHNRFSAWYKVQFDDLPDNLGLDFFQYENARWQKLLQVSSRENLIFFNMKMQGALMIPGAN